ncbi:uncharacterized protein BX664DRAFT_320544 [Halteromyces radiatus]|uniref:uncharacterized protein n=1 Tax=Halteromyces radiatus TaxID=101107 RepID=UPI00221FC600|nr:uncharacterized protein BX664DRAFT_320544 [Halteromyces radiatus]KAI8099162.1 hypothetical protein BX664DRAFT_320544 [Halteromyces radiatus]
MTLVYFIEDKKNNMYYHRVLSFIFILLEQHLSYTNNLCGKQDGFRYFDIFCLLPALGCLLTDITISHYIVFTKKLKLVRHNI